MSYSVRATAHRHEANPSASTPASGFDSGGIVVCMDGSELGERVLPHAVALARACQMPLTLLTVLERERRPDTPPDPFEWELRRHEARRYLAALRERAKTEDLQVEVEVVEGDAAPEICSWDDQHGAGFTALTTHGSGGASPWSLASTAGKLVEGVPGSLLLVPATARGTAPLARYERVVVPLDGSPRAESALAAATRMARLHAAELVLVHVVPIPELTEIGPLDAKDVDLRDRLTRRNERVASAYLDRVRGRLAASHLRIRTRVLRSPDPRDRLVQFLRDEGADLVVLTAHGRGERVDSPLGSFAAHLIRFSESPLLILRNRATPPARGSWTAQEDVRLPSHAAP